MVMAFVGAGPAALAATLGAALGTAALALGAAALGKLGPIFSRPHISRIDTFDVNFTGAFGTNGKTTFTRWS